MDIPNINVHIFDGKFKNKYTPKRTYNKEEKKIAFEKLQTMLKNPLAKKTVEIMTQDMSNLRENKNYQKENNIDASDILFELSQHSDNSCLIHNLDEQLSDVIRLGICPSGRTTRLFQLLQAFSSSFKEK
jgi:hypothetical protein